MTKYREILRLSSLGLSQQSIADSCGVSKKTVNRVLKKATEEQLFWPLDPNLTDAVIAERFFPSAKQAVSDKKMPDFALIRKELLRNGVSKKLLWSEYMEECRQSGGDPLMYSQFCHYIRQDEQKRRATMHISRKPGEQVEVDWAGDPAQITDPDTGEIIKAYLFVGVMTYSQYTFAEAFTDQKQQAWITAHVHMYEFFGGVARILVPDNTKTAVIHNSGWSDQQINAAYQEMAEYYNVAIIPARIRSPKDKPNAEGAVGNISTWITAALRNEQFFSLSELNRAIRKKLTAYNRRPFQKKEGSRLGMFLEEEQPLLAPLPATRFELAEWRKATVQFNYHISVDGMLYSVPYEYIKQKVDVRVTDKTIEVFCKHERIASHLRLHGRQGQYSTIVEHMPKDHQKYLEWSGDRFREWARRIGANTYRVVNAILASKALEQQSYRSCMGLLKLADRYSPSALEASCERALRFTSSPSYKSVRNILTSSDNRRQTVKVSDPAAPIVSRGITRGSEYYGR